MDTWMYLEHSMKSKHQTLYDASSRATWLNLSAPSWIKQTRLNGDDSHPRISSKLLIEDEEANRMVEPKFTYRYSYSLTM